jgi:GT2 family glycosyltransferase
VTSHSNAPADLPRVAVLLLNWNGWNDTVECLESIFRMDYPRLAVVLCDNGSTDGSVDRIRAWASGAETPPLPTPTPLRRLVEPRVAKPIALRECTREDAERGVAGLADREVVLVDIGDNLGFAGGNNVGLQLLRSQIEIDYVWVLNNDIVVDSGALRELVSCASQNPAIGAVGGTLYEYHAPNEVQIAAGGVFPPWKGVGVPLRKVKYRPTSNGRSEPALDYLSGGCVLSPLPVLTKVGLIDEGYFLYGEDVDYSLRIRNAGYLFAYAPNCRVWHKGGGAVGYRSTKHDYYIVRNSLHLTRKYYPRMLPLAMMYVAYRCAMPKLLRGQWRRLRAVRRAYRDFKRGVLGPLSLEATD